MATPYRRFRQIGKNGESEPLLGGGGRIPWWFTLIVVAALLVGIPALIMSAVLTAKPVPDPLTINTLHVLQNGTIDGHLTVGGNVIGKKRDGAMAITVSGGDAMFQGALTSIDGVTIGDSAVTIGKRKGKRGRTPARCKPNKLTVVGSADICGDTNVGGTSTLVDVNVTGFANITNLRIVDMLDTSTSHVLPAPYFIVVGSGTPGVVDWPTSVIGSRQMEEHARTIRQEQKFRKRSTKKQKRVYSNYIPVYPSVFPTIPLPPPGAVYVPTIKAAIALLQGKVITNTTIYLRAGTYNENVVLDGFTSSCGLQGSTDPNESGGPIKCRGVNFIGDGRFIAGYTYMQGVIADALAPPHPAIGSDFSEAAFTCVNSSAISVQRPGNPWWSYTDINPQFDVLGIVPGDKILITDGETRIQREKTVTGVAGNVIKFSPSGCFASGAGASITFMPNRKIVGVAPSPVNSDLIFDSVNVTAGVLNVVQGVNVIGLWITSPNVTSPLLQSPCKLSATSSWISNVVCDNRFTSVWGSAVFFFGGSTNGFPAPNKIQDNQEGDPAFGVILDLASAQYYYAGHITAIAGNVENLGTIVNMESIFVVGGYLKSYVHSSTYVNNLHASSASVDDSQALVLGQSSSLTSRSMGLIGGSGIIADVHGHSYVNIYGDGACKIHGSGGTCVDIRDTSVFNLQDPYGLQGSPVPNGVFSLHGCAVGFDMYGTSKVWLEVDPFFVNVTAEYNQRDATTLAVADNLRVQPLEHTADEAIHPDWRVQHLAGTGARLMTLSATELATMVNKEYAVFSTTAAAHNITLSGGAKWTSTNTVATFPATAGAGITFRVLTSTLIAVTGNAGPVTFSA